MASDIVIIGGEGDLAFRKLYPALFNLDCEKLLEDGIKVFAFCRGKYELEKFLTLVREGIDNSDYTEEVDESVWEKFVQRVVQFKGDATSAASFTELNKQLKNTDCVFYMSTPPSIFSPICKAIDDAGMV